MTVPPSKEPAESVETLPPESPGVRERKRFGVGPGDVLAERYVVQALVGEGGMGAVFLATHRILGREVAIKVLRPELASNPQFSARFLREAQASAQLRHRNIVEVMDYGTHENRPYMVMEFLRGENLGALLKREGVREPGALVALFDPVLRALTMAHERGIVHRDIKPDNIFLMVQPDGELVPKVVDFGIAKAPEQNVELTVDTMALGTPLYMAPEQMMASRNATGAADQYALGVTLYEALTGKNPFDATTIQALIVAKATQDPRPLRELRPELPETFAAVVMKTLERRPEDRFPSVSALREALQPWAADTVELSGGTLHARSDRPLPGAATQPQVPTPGRPAEKPPSPVAAAGTVPSGTPAFNAPSFELPSQLVVAPRPSSVLPAGLPGTPRPRWLLPAVLFGAVAVGGGAVALVRRGPTTTHTEPPPPPPPPPPPVSEQVTFDLTVEPREARIVMDGELLGQGHAAVTRPRGTRSYQVQFSAPGYAPYNLVLQATSDARVDRALQRLPTDPRPRVPPPDPRPPPPQPPAPPPPPPHPPEPPHPPPAPDPRHPTIIRQNPF